MSDMSTQKVIGWVQKGVIKMSSFKFGQKQIPSKYFRNQLTGILTINVNNLVLSDRVSCNDGKDWWYTVGYQVDGEIIIPLFMKTPKNLLTYGVTQFDKNSAFTMSLTMNVSSTMNVHRMYIEWL